MAHPISNIIRPGTAGAIASQEVRAHAEHGQIQGKVPLASEKAAETLGEISSKAFLPQTFQFFGGLALAPIAWVAGKFGGAKAKTIVQAPLAAAAALETTTLGSLQRLPEQVVRAFGAKATENGAAGLEKTADIVANRLAVRGDSVARNVSAFAQPVISRITSVFNGVFGAADKAAATGVVNDTVGRVASWRAASLDRAAARVSDKMQRAHSEEAVGVFKGAYRSVAQFFGAKPVLAQGAVEMAQPLLRVANAGSYDASHAGVIRASIGTIGDAAVTLDASHAARLEAVKTQATKLATVIEKKAFWDSARTGGLGAIVRGIPSALSKVSLGRALIVTGVVAGSAAMLLRTKAENTRGNETLNALAADIYGIPVHQVKPEMLHGANAPELLKRASQDFSKSARGNWLAGAASLAGEGMWLMPNMSMAPAMLMSSVSGFANDILKSDNPYLNAFTLLKAEAQGQGVLKPEQKVSLVTMLVGASPSIAAHGGGRNKMAKPIATQMVNEKLSVEQMVREIASPQGIERWAVKAKAAMDVAAAKPAVPVAANENVPSAKVAGVQPQGRVVSQEIAANR